MRWHILIVEDDLSYRTALERFLKGRFDLTIVSTFRQALVEAEHKRYDLALIDFRLPDGNGLDLIRYLRQLLPDITIIVMTGHGTVETAVKAIQKGAFHYLMKPYPMERLEQLITEAQKHKGSQEKGNAYFSRIVGQSTVMQEIFKLVEKISNSDSTILIRGESGTGKELIARAIHFNSPRRDMPFVTVNCGALQEELLESELFGHTKGAFTGAVHARKGRFEIANSGTIFLDEVGDMSPRLQVKLLRVLQEEQFELLGSSCTIDVDVRIIAATHEDLEKAVAEKRFREDLYYRLNVIPVFLPPLRDRGDDIELLLNYFLEKFNREKGKKITFVSHDALKALQSYYWPGNVRELENLIERLVILKGEGEIGLSDLPDRYFLGKSSKRYSGPELPQEGTDLNELVTHLETELIRQALARTGGNRNKAARLLRLKRTTLVEKLKRKKITPSSV